MHLPGNRLTASLLLIPAGLALLLALAEVFFRVALPAPDVPAVAFVDGVLRHRPGQRGVFWDKEVRACFAVNAQGWNSGHSSYPLARGKALRIALVGGALAEALEVPPRASLAEDLERELGTLPQGAEVFRYGMDGAPLSQHLLVARKAALPAKPDILMVLLEPEDITASHQAAGGPFAAHFQKLRLDAEDMVEELPPMPYAPTLGERLRQWSATLRYLSGQGALRPATAEKLLHRPKPDRRFEAAATATAPPAEADEREVLDRRAARYLFGRLQAEANAAGAKLLVIMDGARAELEAGASGAELERTREPGRLAAAEAELLGIAFLDLHPAFAEDFRQHKKPFGFQANAQWNAYGHAVAASAVLDKLCQLGWLNP